jgi:sugar-specific transcriptional regulator TrmB
MISDELKKFGLSTKESQIYLALLELGTIPVSTVAQKAGINRSTAYVLLDQLSKHGLVSISEKSGGIKLYTAAPPERLIQLLESSIKRYTELVGVAQRILPELKSLYIGSGPKPRVQFFEGVEGIRTAYEDTLTSTETIRAYASIESMHNTLPDYFPDYYKRRTQKNIKIRAIFPDTPKARERSFRDKEEARESILVPIDNYGFSPEINIYDNKVVFMSLYEKFALIIESMELADALKKAFELSWIGSQYIAKKTNGKKRGRR